MHQPNIMQCIFVNSGIPEVLKLFNSCGGIYQTFVVNGYVQNFATKYINNGYYYEG